MIEKLKTGLLVALVVLSLVQSYLLVYSFPTIGATVQTEQEYISAERMGETARIDELVFPEDIVLHLGNDRHAVLHPETGFYDRIYDLVKSGEYRNFQRVPYFIRDWDDLRRTSQGVELRFGGGVPVALLQKVMQLDGDFFFLGDSIGSIWLLQRKFQGQDVSEVYFFSSDGQTVYEPSRAAVSPEEIREIAGLGSYLPDYSLWRGGIYVPNVPLEAVEYTFGYTSYSPQQMQRSLFFDPDRTRYLEDRNGSVIYTDGKRGLELESGDTWMVFTDPVPPQDNPDNPADNAIAALQFVNQHGGWDGRYRFVPPAGEPPDARSIVFRQYFERYPLIGVNLQYGEIRLRMQQGTASVYERSLITRGETHAENALRWLPGGETLRLALDGFALRAQAEALFPALLVSLTEDRKLYMEPAWAVRLTDGSVHTVMKALPRGTVVELPAEETADQPASGVPAPGESGSAGGTGGAVPGLSDDDAGAGTGAEIGETGGGFPSDGETDGTDPGDGDRAGTSKDDAEPGGLAADAGEREPFDAASGNGGAGTARATEAEGSEREPGIGDGDAGTAPADGPAGGNPLPTTEILPSDTRE